jgi:UDP-N-acetylglucosamine acyltransferase
VHQFVRVGAYAFVGGMSGIGADLIPFGMAIGNRANLCGLNIVGLKRKGFPREQIHQLRQAYRMLFSSEGTLLERLEDVEAMFSNNPLAKQIIDFIKSESERSFLVPNNAATPSR